MTSPALHCRREAIDVRAWRLPGAKLTLKFYDDGATVEVDALDALGGPREFAPEQRDALGGEALSDTIATLHGDVDTDPRHRNHAELLLRARAIAKTTRPRSHGPESSAVLRPAPPALDPDAELGPGGPALDERRKAIRLRLVCTGEGIAKANLANVASILALDPEWVGVIGYNAFSESPVLLHSPPQREEDRVARAVGTDWTEQDSTRAATWIASVWGPSVSSRVVTEAVLAIAQRRIVHPVIEYLDDLRWDGEPRLDFIFSRYCSAPDNAYTRGAAGILFKSAVARVRRPGCKVDTIMILQGAQGALKSSLFSALFSPWFSDTPLPIGEKDGYQQLRGVWCVELAELAAFKGRDADRIKAFASSASDTYRPSYERRSRAVPRQCIFVGTTNKEQYLYDETGARRFVPVTVRDIDLQAIRRHRDQLWAEADVRFRNGESWWPDKALESLVADEAEDRFEADAWEDVVRAWLTNPVEVRYVHDEKGRTELVTSPIDRSAGFTMSEILGNALAVPLERQDKKVQGRVATILHRCGYVRGKQKRIASGAIERRWVLRSVGDELVTEGGDA